MKKTSSFLTGFLAMLVAAGLLSSAGTAQAELISINIGPTGFNIGGINGGYPSDRSAIISDFPISGNSFVLHNDFNGILTGLLGRGGFAFATGATAVTPVKFSLYGVIDIDSTYKSGADSLFKYSPIVSPDWASGSYMGFKTAQHNYGWLEVTWKASTSEFQILSGAYESDVGLAILAGAGGAAPVPEPGTWAALAIFAGGAAYSGWRRRKNAKVA